MILLKLLNIFLTAGKAKCSPDNYRAETLFLRIPLKADKIKCL